MHPFDTVEDDHCETGAEAYADIAPLLHKLAKDLGYATTSELKIYDPYYCAGTTKKHLSALGFTHVYNECEDFYKVIKDNTTPPHDVILTNPPYSKDHVQKLLAFCGILGWLVCSCSPASGPNIKRGKGWPSVWFGLFSV